MMQIYLLKKKRSAQKGMVLVAVIGLLIFLALFTVSGATINTSASALQSSVVQGGQALALAQAGAEWYAEQLSADTDWTNQTSETRALGTGSFEITINSQSATEVNFTSKGSVTADLGNGTIERRVTQTLQKLSPGFQFALYQGYDPGAALQLLNSGTNPTQITGDVWSRGSVVIDGINAVTGGRVYAPSTSSISGTGTYSAKTIAAPFPSMPSLTTTVYTDAMNAYDTALNGNASATNKTVSAGVFNINTNNDPSCSAGVCNYRTFTTNGNVTITGTGTINVTRDILLHGAAALAGGTTLTISPSGGPISIITNRGITIGSSNNNPVITIDSNCYFYSRSQGSTAYLIRIRGSNTTLTDAKVYSRRRTIIETGADLLGNSEVFLDYPNNTTNNYLWLIGGPGVTTVEGALISLGQNNPGLRVDNGGTGKSDALVRGVVHAYGTTTGYCQLADATFQGSVVCSRYSTNQVSNIAVTYDNSLLFDLPTSASDGSVAKKRNTWDSI